MTNQISIDGTTRSISHTALLDALENSAQFDSVSSIHLCKTYDYVISEVEVSGMFVHDCCAKFALCQWDNVPSNVCHVDILVAHTAILDEDNVQRWNKFRLETRRTIYNQMQIVASSGWNVQSVGDDYLSIVVRRSIIVDISRYLDISNAISTIVDTITSTVRMTQLSHIQKEFTTLVCNSTDDRLYVRQQLFIS